VMNQTNVKDVRAIDGGIVVAGLHAARFDESRMKSLPFPRGVA